MQKLSNINQVLKARSLDNPWVEFNEYKASDLMDETLCWSIAQEDIVSSFVEIINDAFYKRQKTLKRLQLRLCDGLAFAIEHSPLLLVETSTGVKAVFLDQIWDGRTQEGEVPERYRTLNVRKLLFVASFDKSNLQNVQDTFKKARWSQMMLLSDFERRFLLSNEKKKLIKYRQSQYVIFRYILDFYGSDPRYLRPSIAHQNHPEELLDVYKQLPELGLPSVIDRVLALFIGGESVRGDKWSKPLAQRLQLAGDSYAKELLKSCIEFIAREASLVLPASNEENKDDPEVLAIMAEYEKFARIALPAHSILGQDRSPEKSPASFQKIEPTDDFMGDYKKPLDRLIETALVIERTITKAASTDAADDSSDFLKSLVENFGPGEISSRIIARFLTVLHQKQAVYEYEDIKQRSSIAGVLIFFDDGFVDLAKVLMMDKNSTKEELIHKVLNITLYAICSRVAALTKDTLFIEYMHDLKDDDAIGGLLDIKLTGHPKTDMGEECPILNIRCCNDGNDGYEVKGDKSLLRTSTYWIFANLPFDDKQLVFLKKEIIDKKGTPTSALYSLPRQATPLEDSRRKLLIGVLANKEPLPEPPYNYRKFLVGKDTTQTQLIKFDERQKLPSTKVGAPVLSNCMYAGDGEYVLQRLTYKPRGADKVVGLLEDVLDEFLSKNHSMMLSDKEHYRRLVSYYRRADKNPEVDYFLSLPDEHWQAVYIYYKELGRESVNAGEAKASFKQALRYLEYLLRGYMLVPFYVLRTESRSASLSHLLGMPQKGILHQVYDNTQQMVLIVNKNLPPFSVLGFDAIKVINAIVSGDCILGLNGPEDGCGVIHRKNLVDLIQNIDKKQENNDDTNAPNVVEKNILLRGEFLVSLEEFTLRTNDESSVMIPIRKLTGDDESKVVTLSEFEKQIKSSFDLLPKIEDQVLIIPADKAAGYVKETALEGLNRRPNQG